MKAVKEKFNCDHCGKKDCEQCVKEDGKTFCCEHCCDDYKQTGELRKEKEPENVCRFC